MNYLQISDPWLRRAASEYAAQRELPPGAADGVISLEIAGNVAVLREAEHEVDRYPLPLRLPRLMADIAWCAARQREVAEKFVALNENYTLEAAGFCLKCGDVKISITGREVALLQHLRHFGESAREDLLVGVWRYHPESDTHTVETHLWRLRQKLQDAGAPPLILTTEKGYRLA